MANNYTYFSALLPLPNNSDAAKAQAFIDAWEDESCAVENDPEREDSWWENYAGFEYEFRQTEGVWVHDTSESGNVEAAANFIQRYLRDLGIKEAIYMSWANTCSKPRINEFDGGGVVVTAAQMYWVNSYAAVQKAIDDGVAAESIIGG